MAGTGTVHDAVNMEGPHEVRSGATGADRTEAGPMDLYEYGTTIS